MYFAEGAPETQVVAAVGDSLFRHVTPAWEFFFLHDDGNILDFAEFESNGKVGLFVISENKVTKWTNELKTKTVYLKLKDMNC